MMQILAKVTLYLGIILLIGAGVFTRWIGARLPSREAERRARAGRTLGAIFIIGGSALEIVDTIARVAGGFDSSLLLPYLLETRHGNAVTARVAVAALLWALAAGPAPGAGARAAFLVLAAGLLLTFSAVSHAGARGNPLSLGADLLHLAGVSAWAGAVVYAAWLLPWGGNTPAPLLLAAVRRLSALGLTSVMVIAATGLYAAVVNLWGFPALTGTPYGRTLLVKLAVVCLVLIVAAVNRWVLVPWMSRGLTAVPFGRLVKVEASLQLLVLAATGVLVSQALPTRPATLGGEQPFQETIGSWTLRGTLIGRGAAGIAIELIARDARGIPVPASVQVSLVLAMMDHPMPLVKTSLARVGPGEYRGTVQLPMAGGWQMTILTPEGTVAFPLRTMEAAVAPPSIIWALAGPSLLAVVVGVTLAVTGLRRLGVGAGRPWAPLAAGAALMIVGAVVAVQALR